MSKKRILSYDVIRIVAIFAVVMVHVVSIYLRRAPVDSVEFITANVWGSLARIGVPMFVMLSGALLLNEERSYSYKTMGKQIGNMLFLLVFWSLFYAIVHKKSELF